MNLPHGEVERRHGPSVALIDLLPGRALLLTAVLRSLGCQVYPVDCSGHWPAALDQQLASHGPFDVVLWDLSTGLPPHPWIAALAGGDRFGKSGVVIAASLGQEVPRPLRGLGERTQLLLSPFTPTTLMAAVNAAARMQGSV